MNVSDLPFLAAALAVAIVVTALVFFVLRAIGVKAGPSKVLGATVFPALLIVVIVYVEVWNPDPHGFVMVGLGFLALVSLPVTTLTTVFLASRF